MELFDRNIHKFDALICLNGSLPEKTSFFDFKYNLLLAADGAADKIFAKGLKPDYIIGDFDSLNKNAIPEDYDIQSFIVDHSQETNDFEKILTYCSENKLNRIIIFGIHGGELEHTLNNISVFKKFTSQLDMMIFDEGRLGIFIDDYIKLPTHRGEMISLIPIPKAKLSTRNLKWELDEEILELGIREGARNKANADFIEIFVHQGEILLFFAPVF